MAAQVNVYVPDELKARLDAADLSLSQIARTAWERQLSLSDDGSPTMQLVETTDDDGFGVRLRFKGEEVVGDLVYRKADGGAVLVFEDGGYHDWTLNEIEDDEEAFDNAIWRCVGRGRDGRDAHAEALRAFGIVPTIDL